MKTGNIRDFIVHNNLEEELLGFVPKCEKRDVEEWLEFQDLSY